MSDIWAAELGVAAMAKEKSPNRGLRGRGSRTVLLFDDSSGEGPMFNGSLTRLCSSKGCTEAQMRVITKQLNSGDGRDRERR